MLLLKRWYLFVKTNYFSLHATLVGRVQILYSIFLCTWIGCPQAINFFGSNQKKWYLICFSCFLVCFAKLKLFFRFVSLFQTGIKIKETNRTFSEKNLKISKKRSPLGCPRETINFFDDLNRNKLKLNLFWLFFDFFSAKPRKHFSVCFGLFFDVSDQHRNNRNKQNLYYGELKRFLL